MIFLGMDDVAPLIARGIKEALDRDHWAVMRLAELRAAGERPTAVVQWYSRHEIGFVFVVKIRRADGTIEEPPSAITGQTTTMELCGQEGGYVRPEGRGRGVCALERGHDGPHDWEPPEWGNPEKGKN